MNKKYKFMLLSLMFIFLICLNVASASSNETTQLDLTDDSDIESLDFDEAVISDNGSDVSSDTVVVSDNPNANKSTVPKKSVLTVEKEFTRVANDYFAGERGGYFYGYLTDEAGNPLANKTVQITINGPVYNVTTDELGRAGLQVNIAYENIYTYALAFKGDDQYNASDIASSKLTVTPKKTSISASAKTFKKSAKTKSVSVTLKTIKNPYDGKTYLKSGKKLTLKINGKTYTAKINAKGVAKFNIKLTKKGKYTAKISFAGDRTYKKSSKSVKITIK